jgi:hypothetical protein
MDARKRGVGDGNEARSDQRQAEGHGDFSEGARQRRLEHQQRADRQLPCARRSYKKNAAFGLASNQTRLAPKPTMTIALMTAATSMRLRPAAMTNNSSGHTR